MGFIEKNVFVNVIISCGSTFALCKEIIQTKMKKVYTILFSLTALLLTSSKTEDFNISEMILVEGGQFLMGSPYSDGLAEKDEQPQNTVSVDSFYMSKYEVTVEEWKAYIKDKGISMPAEPKWGWEDSFPMSSVTWLDAVDYCNWLSEKHSLEPAYSKRGSYYFCNFSATGYRLPTEAEWEYAARGGKKSKGYLYAGANNPDRMSWNQTNSEGRPHTIGTRYANELGIHDLNGNVWEWCWDIYDELYYKDMKKELTSTDNPKGGTDGDYRVVKGGSWDSKVSFLRPGNKVRAKVTQVYDFFGFRIVKSAK